MRRAACFIDLGDCDIDYPETPLDAHKDASEQVDRYRESAADDGWDDEVEGLCWGIIVQVTEEYPAGRWCETCGLDEAEHNDPKVVIGECEAPDWADVSDYALVDAPGLADALVEVLQARPDLAVAVVERLKVAGPRSIWLPRSIRGGTCARVYLYDDEDPGSAWCWDLGVGGASGTAATEAEAWAAVEAQLVTEGWALAGGDS